MKIQTTSQENAILDILEQDNATAYFCIDKDGEHILIDGHISFDALAKVVDYLRQPIPQGVL